jgi:hypothetical protein
MKMVKSLFLGSAAALVAVAGAQAADLPVKAKPVQYVKICSLYGAGFYYIPGTDTCIKLGGFVRIEENFYAGGSYTPDHATFNFNNPNASKYYERTRGLISVDARSQTEYGTLRSYLDISMQDNNGNSPGGSPYFGANTASPTAAWANNAFIQLAGFTAGKTTSFFDFDLFGYSNQTNIWGSNQSGNGVPLFAYTAQLGNGLSASISAEDNDIRSSSIFENGVNPAGSPALSTLVNDYAAKGWPDIVGNLRVDQAWGSAQVMAGVHDVNAAASTTTGVRPGDKTGWAVGAGIKINLPQIGNGDNITAQVAYDVGAQNYAIGGATSVGQVFYNLQGGFPAVTQIAYGQIYDSVVDPTGAQHLSSSWSITSGFEHRWSPMWKSSLYGAYGQVKYDATSAAVLAGQSGAVGCVGTCANWSMWQVGSRTVWTPVENLDLSVEVMYQNIQTAYGGLTNGAGATFQDRSFLTGMFRIQRNFWP